MRLFLPIFTFFFAAVSVATASESALQVLAEMNLARTAPREYAAILGARMAKYEGREGHRVVDEAVRFLERAAPLPPLTFSEGLSGAALLHVSEQGPRGGRGHGSMTSRMAKFGQWQSAAGENIHYGPRDARGIVCALIVDDGVRGRKHRDNIFSRSFRVAGIACGPHATYGAMCVMDFAAGFTERGRVAGL